MGGRCSLQHAEPERRFGSGGKEQNVTFDSTVLTPKLRIMANYVLVFNDEYADGNGTLIGEDSRRSFRCGCSGSFETK